MELIQDARNALDVQQARKLVAPMPVVWPSGEDCDRALTLLTALRLSTGLGLLDALIAATAIGHSATLYSFNVKHYRAITDLDLAQPYQR